MKRWNTSLSTNGYKHKSNAIDIIGAFAHTISQFEEPQATRKKANGHMIWATWLVDKNASPDVIEAFNMAWKEYQHQVRPS